MQVPCKFFNQIKPIFWFLEIWIKPLVYSLINQNFHSHVNTLIFTVTAYLNLCMSIIRNKKSVGCVRSEEVSIGVMSEDTQVPSALKGVGAEMQGKERKWEKETRMHKLEMRSTQHVPFPRTSSGWRRAKGECG